MSSHEDSFLIPVPPEQAKPLCEHAVRSLGLTLKGDLGHGIVCGESFEFGFTWPVTMNVFINHGTPGMSRIDIGASNFGFGPIQSSHVRNKVAAVRQRIEQMAHQPPVSSSAQPTPRAQPQPATPPQPSSTRQVFVNGVLLGDDQVSFLEQKYRSQLPNGNYWYDRMCGSWGKMGGPVLCTIEPNLDLGGRLQPGASAGDTGVFINGRELHYLETALLQRVVPMITPGRWWLDVYGNFGSEGGPMLGNIWELAQRQGAGGDENRRTVLSSWDRTGVAIFG